MKLLLILFQILTLDISDQTERHVVIEEGTRKTYNGHPTTLLMPDGKTMYCVWTIGHGGFCGPVAVSHNGGLTWKRINNRMPKGFKSHSNCPSIFLIENNIWIFSAQPCMPRIMSRDGKNWKEYPSLGFRCNMAFSSIIKRKEWYYGYYHRNNVNTYDIMMSRTKDGFEWSEPKVVAYMFERQLAEPFVFYSPDSTELCCLMRDDNHRGNSAMMFSRNGRKWPDPIDTIWGLTGDRHKGIYLPDGRLLIAFRDVAIDSPTKDHFICWVGTYDEIKSGGGYRIKLLHSFAGSDCGYPGLELLPDGTIIATTYIKYKNDNCKHSIVSTRFKIDEL